jgi:hypothetical protein
VRVKYIVIDHRKHRTGMPWNTYRQVTHEDDFDFTEEELGRFGTPPDLGEVGRAIRDFDYSGSARYFVKVLGVEQTPHGEEAVDEEDEEG